MSRRTAAVLVVAFAGAAAPVACSSDATPDPGARAGGSIVVARSQVSFAPDPALATSAEDLQVMWAAYTAPLTFRHAPGRDGTQVVPALARSMPERSADGLTYAFTLRRGLRYSDGRPVRATDFTRALERSVSLNPRARELFGRISGLRAFLARPRRGRGRGPGIAGVVADNRSGRVRILLDRPDAGFTQALASPLVSPLPRGTPASAARRPPPGIGPYRLARDGRRPLLLRRRGWRLANVPAGNVDVISFRALTGARAVTRAAIAGRVDVARVEPPRTLLPDVRATYERRYREQDVPAVLSVWLDTARRPFRDRDLRRAVARAFDTKVIARIEDGFLDPACSLLAPQLQAARPPGRCPYGDREGAPDLVASRDGVDRSPDRRAPVLVAPGPGRHGRALARYLTDTLVSLGMRARSARTARERRKAQVRPVVTEPWHPLPPRYLAPAADRRGLARIRRAQADPDPARAAERWRALDVRLVARAAAPPLGVLRAGVLFSARVDVTNCSLFSPVYGEDLSALCLR